MNVVHPAGGLLAGRHRKTFLGLATHRDQLLEIRAGQLEILRIAAREQHGVGRADLEGLSHTVVAVRPPPAIKATPPLAVEILAHLPGEADVVRRDAPVLPCALQPGAHVFLHPVGVLPLAGEQEGVGGKAGGCNVGWHIPTAVQALPKRDAVAAGVLWVVEVGDGVDSGDIFNRQAIDGHAFGHDEGPRLLSRAEIGARASITRRADDLQL